MNYSLEDIIVFEGVITKFGIIRALLNADISGCKIRMANKEEVLRYNNRP